LEVNVRFLKGDLSVDAFVYHQRELKRQAAAQTLRLYFGCFFFLKETVFSSVFVL
jgi:hypothetical protein